MKTAEEILNENNLTGKLSCRNSDLSENDRSDFIYAIGQAQKEAYNEAINDAANVALCERTGFGHDQLTGNVSKESILNLLIP